MLFMDIDERFVEIVMAVVQLKQETSMSEEDVIEYCKSKLALYKVPRKVVFDEVPRNPTGKVLKPMIREKYTGKMEAFVVWGRRIANRRETELGQF